jgi:predicted nucleic acid-binding protein
VIVVDANVAAKWYLPERGSAEAEQLLNDARRIFAPALIRIEVAGAITRKVRNGKVTPEDARRLCDVWVSQLEANVVSLIPDDDVFESAMLLSIEIKHALQDCLYLAVARKYDVPLITADRPFFERAVLLDERVTLLAGCEVD